MTGPAPHPDVGRYDFETRQIHAGVLPEATFGARITPIYQTAGYLFGSFDEAEGRFAGTSAGDIYSRSENPTNAVVQRRLADLEGGVGALLVASGQAAIASTVFALASAGQSVLATRSLYEGTKQMFRGSLRRQGVSFDFLDAEAPEEEWLARATPRTRALYTESIPNPKNDIVDLAKLARIAHRIGVPLVVDNTVATPYLLRPIEHGADIVIHSTSKWLSGHGSVLGGAIVDGGRFDWAANGDRFPVLSERGPDGSASYLERHGEQAFLRYLRRDVVNEYGPTLPPQSAFALLQGIETLSLRMDRHVANAREVAAWLEAHPAVASVDHPDLPSSPFHERAKALFPRGAGSVLAFDLRGGREAARTVLDSLRLVSTMTHIGDVRTLAIHSGSTLHGRLTERERRDVGVTPGLIRLSVGLESVRDILGDLDQALARL
ncbi:O-acetylhomoserine aminocarboxypropyltransferase/cysteine synthase family protein [Microbacteriaceae bacterium 4G12]